MINDRWNGVFLLSSVLVAWWFDAEMGRNYSVEVPLSATARHTLRWHIVMSAQQDVSKLRLGKYHPAITGLSTAPGLDNILTRTSTLRDQLYHFLEDMNHGNVTWY